MFPARGPPELSTAIDGEVLTRSLPSTWSIVRNSALRSIGALHVWPLSVDRAKPVVFPNPKNVPGNGKRRHTTYALLDPAANAGSEAWPSADVAATIFRGVHVGGFARMLSVYVLAISTPPAANGV